MQIIKTKQGRRSFIKSTAVAGGGMMLGFSWLAGCKSEPTIVEEVLQMPDEWFNINGFLKIGENGVVTIMSPNPEIGQNIKTSMPMIVAEELDIDWKKVVVEQAPLDTKLYKRQLAGGSQSIRQGWKSLRMAGATARRMLCEAAAKSWEVPVEEITTEAGILYHKATEKSGHYGEFASAAALIEVPEEVALKDIKDFKIIGNSKRNVDGKKIVTGQPLFGLDTQREGMLYASIVHPPAFGMKLKSLNEDSVKKMAGVKDVFTINTYPDLEKKQWCDVDAFSELIVVVGDSTWQVMQAKKAIEAEWEESPATNLSVKAFGRTFKMNTPAGFESTAQHAEKMVGYDGKVEVKRKDGDPDAAFKNAAQIIESTYTAPFLAHNCMEPMNFFADVKEGKVELVGPIQTPEFMEKSVSERLGMPLENIDIQMTRMGGGFGRRLYGHFLVEAALISQKVGAPIKLTYTREDDMTFGCYRPAYHATYRAALDENKNLIGFHIKAGGIPESPLFADRFPAGAIDNYLAEAWTLESNISTGAWRAPRSNFIAGAEQAFLDEVAEAMGKDPIELRLDLLERAKNTPVGEKNDYDAARYAGVLKLVKEKSGWGKGDSKLNRGVSAYFCHNSYVANVLDLSVKDGKPVVDKVFCAVDCGIVVNPDAAKNMMEGGTVDGIGHALFSGLTFKDGVPEQSNFDKYRLIRHSEAPKEIQVDFVESDTDPTGLGEPPFPPIIGAVANALYKATGKRVYDQPFVKGKDLLG